MAKNKGGGAPNKPDSPQQLEEALKAFSALSEKDKGILLRRAGVFFLQFAWRPVAPTPELRSIVNHLSRLSFLMNTMMRQATMRRVTMDKLVAISEAQVLEKVVKPVNQVISQYSTDLQRVLDNKKPTNTVELDYKPQKTQSEWDNGEGEEAKQNAQKGAGTEDNQTTEAGAEGSGQEGPAAAPDDGQQSQVDSQELQLEEEAVAPDLGNDKT